MSEPLTAEELAVVRHRDALATEDWLPPYMPLYARTAFDDRRRLLATLDAERAAAAGGLASVDMEEIARCCSWGYAGVKCDAHEALTAALAAQDQS